MNRKCFNLYIFFFKSKRLNDITVHNSININIKHLFTLNFELYSALHILTTNIYFPLSHKNTKIVV